MIDFYLALHVKRDASTEQILRAYQKIMKRRRPAASDVEATVLFDEIQAEVQNAFETLSDLARRRHYDAQLDNVELMVSIAEDFGKDKATRKLTATREQIETIKVLLRARAAMRISGVKG